MLPTTSVVHIVERQNSRVNSVAQTVALAQCSVRKILVGRSRGWENDKAHTPKTTTEASSDLSTIFVNINFCKQDSWFVMKFSKFPFYCRKKF